jgi:hypothetical protein
MNLPKTNVGGKESSDKNMELKEALAILNPATGPKWRRLPERYGEASIVRNVVPPIPLSMDDYKYFHIEYEPYQTWFHVKTNTERGREIADSYYLPPYLPHIRGWIEAQNAFVKSLTPREQFVLKAYTYYGDRLVNRYLRDERSDVEDLVSAMEENGSNPFMYQIADNYEKLRKMGGELPSTRDKEPSLAFYVDILKSNHEFFTNLDVVLLLSKAFFQDLMRIFLKAPRLPSSIVVFRGIISEAHLKSLDFRSIDFQSTSLNPYKALFFTKDIGGAYTESEELALEQYAYGVPGAKIPTRIRRRDKYGSIRCCIYEITVTPSVPCIYMEGFTHVAEEFEVLLPPGVDMKLEGDVDIRALVPPAGVPVWYAVLEPVEINAEGRLEFFEEYLESASTKTHDRVAVVQAEATSVYFAKKKKAPSLVLNTSLRYARSHKTKKAHRTPTSTKKERAYEKRAILRGKTLRKKERRRSVRRSNVGNSNSR